MRVPYGLEDFNLCEQVLRGRLVQGLLCNHLYCYYLSTVSLPGENQEPTGSFHFQSHMNSKCVLKKWLFLLTRLSLHYCTVYWCGLLRTHLSVGFVDSGVGPAAQSLCEDEIGQFRWCEAGAGSHVDRSRINGPFWATT